MHQFLETHPEFKGFSAFYERELHPFLMQTETERSRKIGRLKKIIPVIVLIAVAIAALLWTKTQHIMTLIVPLIGGAAASTALYHFFLEGVKANTKTHLVGGICQFVGLDFKEKLDAAPDLTPFFDNKLLPSRFDRVSFEDHMFGNAHSAEFSSSECHMERKYKDKNGKTQWKTIFRGAVMTIDFHRKFLGRTVVLRDKGIFNSKKKSDMKRVGLVDPKFEKIFEAYGTDQVEARYILSPDFMQRLVDIETSVDGKNIRFGFVNNLLYVAVETANRFEAGSMLKPITDTSRTQKILDEIGAIYDLVDGVLKPQNPSGFRS